MAGSLPAGGRGGITTWWVGVPGGRLRWLQVCVLVRRRRWRTDRSIADFASQGALSQGFRRAGLGCSYVFGPFLLEYRCPEGFHSSMLLCMSVRLSCKLSMQCVRGKRSSVKQTNGCPDCFAGDVSSSDDRNPSNPWLGLALVLLALVSLQKNPTLLAPRSPLPEAAVVSQQRYLYCAVRSTCCTIGQQSY